MRARNQVRGCGSVDCEVRADGNSSRRALHRPAPNMRPLGRIALVGTGGLKFLSAERSWAGRGPRRATGRGVSRDRAYREDERRGHGRRLRTRHARPFAVSRLDAPGPAHGPLARRGLLQTDRWAARQAAEARGGAWRIAPELAPANTIPTIETVFRAMSGFPAKKAGLTQANRRGNRSASIPYTRASISTRLRDE